MIKGRRKLRNISGREYAVACIAALTNRMSFVLTPPYCVSPKRPPKLEGKPRSRYDNYCSVFTFEVGPIDMIRIDAKSSAMFSLL